MNVDRLVDDIQKDVYVLRMARAMEASPLHGKSARTRAANARAHIEEIVRRHVAEDATTVKVYLGDSAGPVVGHVTQLDRETGQMDMDITDERVADLIRGSALKGVSRRLPPVCQIPACGCTGEAHP